MPSIGDTVPDTSVMITTADGPGPVSSAELLGTGTVVLIGVLGAFTTAMGMDTDASSFGLGTRSERYAAILRDGVITSLDVEKQFVDLEVSSAESVLARL